MAIKKRSWDKFPGFAFLVTQDFVYFRVGGVAKVLERWSVIKDLSGRIVARQTCEFNHKHLAYKNVQLIYKKPYSHLFSRGHYHLPIDLLHK